MAQTSKSIRKSYNKRTYRQFKFQVRRNSDLCACLEQTAAAKSVSLNYIITKLLAEHYEVSMPEPHLDNE